MSSAPYKPLSSWKCDRGQSLSPVLSRVQIDATGRWQFVCHDCWALNRQPQRRLWQHLESL